MTNPTMRVISLGAGVQSSTMALMAAKGEIAPMPDCAIFSDTQWEQKRVYSHLEWLKSVLPFPVHTTTGGNIRDHIITATKPKAEGGRFASVPFYSVIHAANGHYQKGKGRRQCTREFKLEPLIQKQRELLGVPKGQRVPKGIVVEVWIGISTDEAHRMNKPQKSWQVNRYPLIDMEMSRLDCLNWLKRNGYPRAPKSSCIGCPFHNDSFWVDMRDNDPEAWADAIEVDNAIRAKGTLRSMAGLQYMHSSCIPLGDVVFRQDYQPNLFGNDCLGMCGV